MNALLPVVVPLTLPLISLGIAPTVVEAAPVKPASFLAAPPVYRPALTEAKFLQTTVNSDSTWAQVTPNLNPDRFLQAPETIPPTPLPDNLPRLMPEVSPPPTPSATEPVTIPVRSVRVIGSTVFTDVEFAPLIAPIVGQTVALSEINQVVSAITQLYLDSGYLTSRAILPQQAVQEGAIVIQIVEGFLSQIEIQGLQHLQASYLKSRINRGVALPLNINDLEDQLRLLQLDPNLDDFTVALQSGETLGSSILTLDVHESPRFFGDVFIDNSAAASVGSTRSGMELGYRNLLGIGDVVNLSYYQTFAGGSDVWSLGYTVPVNPLNGTLRVATVRDRNRIIQDPFDVLNIRGESEFYELSFRQPLKRTATEEFALSLGFDHRTGQTFVFDTIGAAFSPGAEADGTTKTSVLRFGQDYTKRSAKGAWSLRSQFSFGTDLFAATQNPGVTPDGQFFAWLGQIARVERLSKHHLLIIQGDIQLSGDNLLSSEQFGFGGAQTLRGYRQGARSADNGWRISIEDRITLFEDKERDKLVQIAPFFDFGVVWNNPSNPNPITNENVLAGLGTGLIVQPEKNLTLRLDFTVPLVKVRDRQNDLQDDGIYFRLLYLF